MVPDCIAALVGIARWIPDDVCIGAQFVRSFNRRVQYNSRRSPHDFLHQHDVGFDPVNRCLDQHRIMYRCQKFDAVSCRKNAGNPQDISAGCLHWPVAQ